MTSGGETAKTKMVVGDPSYFPDKVEKDGQVVRCICLMNHPIPNTGDIASCQVIIPQREAKRNSGKIVAFVGDPRGRRGRERERVL